MVDFWARVPLRQRVGQRLRHELAQRVGWPSSSRSTFDHLQERMDRQVRMLALDGVAKKVRNIGRRSTKRSRYQNDELAAFALFGEERYSALVPRHGDPAVDARRRRARGPRRARRRECTLTLRMATETLARGSIAADVRVQARVFAVLWAVAHLGDMVRNGKPGDPLVWVVLAGAVLVLAKPASRPSPRAARRGAGRLSRHAAPGRLQPLRHHGVRQPRHPRLDRDQPPT